MYYPRIRLILVAAALSAFYSMLLVYTARTLGWLTDNGLLSPITCCDFLGSLLHTVGIMLPAGIVATAALAIDAHRAMAISALASIAAAALALLWSTDPQMRHVIWNYQILYITADLIKIALGVPLSVWCIRGLTRV